MGKKNNRACKQYKYVDKERPSYRKKKQQEGKKKRIEKQQREFRRRRRAAQQSVDYYKPQSKRKVVVEGQGHKVALIEQLLTGACLQATPIFVLYEKLLKECDLEEVFEDNDACQNLSNDLCKKLEK